MLNLRITLIFLLFFNLTFSQTQRLFNRYIYFDDEPYKKLNTDFSLYYHNGIKPGLNFSTDRAFSRKAFDKNKLQLLHIFGTKEKEIKTIKIQNVLQGNGGFYVHRKNHMGFYANAQLIRRRINEKNTNFEFGLGVGILKTFLPTTYEFTDKGLRKVFLPGRLYFTGNLSMLYGRELKFITKKPVLFFVRPSASLKIPYNHFINFAYAMEWGIRIKIFDNKHEN